MCLSHEHVGSKIPAKINTYMLTRAELLIHLCYEIPCSKRTSKCECCEVRFTSQEIVFENLMRRGLKGGISIDADSGPLVSECTYFDAAVVFVTNSLLLFRLALAIL
jgi:hypothetical protein